MPRLFLAVPLPKETKTRIAPEIERLKKTLSDWTINWVAPENLHITLVFFGWTKEEQIEGLETEISAALSGFAPFEIETGPLSLEGRPLWLEIRTGNREIQSVAEALSRKLAVKGSLEEERGFHAHLTLGRVKRRGKAALPGTFPRFSWRADRAVLYGSTFKGGRRIYTPAASFPLSA